MKFWLNEAEIDYQGDPKVSLLKFIRDIQGITSPKDGCSRQGACGACTVVMDDRAILSCVTPMSKVEGKKITTTDGLEQDIQEAFATAFTSAGGIQCGFCTPGIVMSARVLLLKNPNPTRLEVTSAINRHICRCTGFVKIVDSILLAAKILRGEETEINIDGNIGARLDKYDAYDTVLGQRPFVCDITVDNMHYGALKFSDHPRAKINKIDVAAAERVEGVIRVLTASDISGEQYTGLIVKDWPVMVGVGDTTRYIGDVVAQVVASSEEIAREAVSKIKVDYEVLKPLIKVDAALKENAPKVHPGRKDNILSCSNLLNGDPEVALKEAAYVSKGTYYSQRVEHAFLEPECCLAVPNADWGLKSEKSLTIYSQGQGAYEDRKGIANILGVDLKRVNVVQVQNGGGFGGKEDLSVQGHAALGAFITGVPVRVLLTREQSLIMHPKRHPMRLDYTLGCDKSGKLTVLKARIHGDTGAYASVGMKVLERAAGHATGGYEVPHIDLEALAVYTNNIPCGAMRGFGVNQSAFAMEGCIDELCERGGFDRWQFRYDNALDEGKTTSTGQVLEGGIGLRKSLEAVKDAFYSAKYAGLACGIKNTGIGNGMADTAKAKIVIEDRDHIIIHHGWTEMGQGVHTVAIQTVCEETGLDPNIMEVKVETDEDTFCGMTTSSRGTAMVGNSLKKACVGLAADLKNSTLNELKGKVYYGEWICDWTTDSFCEKPDPNPVTHFSYGYATQVVILDEQSGKIKKVIAAHDAGRIINPKLFEGQIEGGVHMGLGYALSENFPMKDGFPTVNKFGRLGILRAKDTPEIEVIGIEATDPHGPYGAKGIGEIGLVPTAAAVANALYQFDKIRRYSLPIGIKKGK